MQKTWRYKLTLYLAVYSFGLLIVALFQALVLTRRIVIQGAVERLRKHRGPMILVANHPSLMDPFLVPLLCSGSWLKDPRLLPWNTPDQKNYVRWYWKWWLFRSIIIPRGNRAGEMGALKQMRRALQAGDRLVLFPEGGRTSSGDTWLVNQAGHKIRPFKAGLGWLVHMTRATVIPIWLEGTDIVLPNKAGALYHTPPHFGRAKITIRVGEPMTFFEGESRELINSLIQRELLALAQD